MKICPAGAEMFHTDGRTGRPSLWSSLCYFPQPPVTSFYVQMSPSALHPRSHPTSVFFV